MTRDESAMTDRELMEKALDALESVFEGDDKGAEYWTVTGGTYEAVECMQVMRALRARLAQPEQEPVAYMDMYGQVYNPHELNGEIRIKYLMKMQDAPTPLYYAPPQRDWQGLTDEEIHAVLKSCNTTDTYKYFRAIEAKLKEKNG